MESNNEFINRELRGLILGDMIGEGLYRKVYAHRQDPTMVVKIEEQGGCFSNVMEWELWNQLRHTSLGWDSSHHWRLHGTPIAWMPTNEPCPPTASALQAYLVGAEQGMQRLMADLALKGLQEGEES